MITEAQLDRALYVFNDVPRTSMREALREAIKAAQPSMEQGDAEITANVAILTCENCDYLRLTVEPKGEPLRRFRISNGNAEGLHASLGALLEEQRLARAEDHARRFLRYSNRDIYLQLRMQARDELDPEYSSFLSAAADRLESLSGKAASA